MKPLVWMLEWRLALARRRSMVLSTLVPLALVIPLGSGAVAAPSAAAYYVVLFSFFGMLGAALPLLRDGEVGLAYRVLRGGVSPASYLLQRAGAAAVIDVLALTPAVLVAALTVGSSIGEVLLVFVALGATAWIAGLLGVVVAAVSRSVAEVALLAAAGGFLLFHMSGVFRTPVADSAGAALEAVSPFRALHEALLSMTTGVPVAGGGAAAALWCVLLPAAVALVAPRLVRWLGPSARAQPAGA